ncbi:hypothetical protein ES319_D12G091200v1 [Gossypium barbadense]|uniref:Uncharacterized protein n=1 Tax=Gossypium barbadense TaxID=3634 RepID=A0A5J5P0A0_GOSBA|nr:hypothetical protein ES319_D12G091200v1 [Gossypium barbadense]
MGLVFLEQKLVGQKVDSGGLYRLLQCASKGDKAGVIQELDKGVEPNGADYDRRTALHLAACEGWIEVVDLLLEKDLGSSFWGMALILASTNLLTARIAAGCFLLTLVVVLFYAKNWTLRGLSIGFIIFLALIWFLQERTTVHILRYAILFIGIGSLVKYCLFLILEIAGVMNSMFSVYDIYDDLISRGVNSSDAKKFAEICPCPCNGVGWGFIWGMISFIFLGASVYLGLLILA